MSDPQVEERPAEMKYVERILEPARELGFPEWYSRKLESYRP